jgi:benzoyl-CoA reductase subunit C
MVIPHGCDSMVRGYSAWNYSLDLPYFHFVNIPSVAKESSLEFFYDELNAYRKSIEKFIGRTITDQDLSAAVKLHNQNRTKVRALYEFRKADPPILSGTELTKTLTVAASLPIEESNSLLDEVLAQMGNRKESPFKPGPRILIDGPCVDNMEVMKIIEDLGAHVVTDTLCNGTRDNWPRVNETKILWPPSPAATSTASTAPRPTGKTRRERLEGDIKARFGDIGYFAKSFKVDGAVALHLQVLRSLWF